MEFAPTKVKLIRAQGECLGIKVTNSTRNWVLMILRELRYDEYKDGSFVIPAGINGILKIDGKANPRIARGG